MPPLTAKNCQKSGKRGKNRGKEEKSGRKGQILPNNFDANVQGGQSTSLDREKLSKIGKKEGKIGKKRKNREEKAKIGKVLSLCPS